MSGAPIPYDRAIRAWLDTPAGGVVLLILTTLLLRLAFADSLGLGIDESYMVATGRGAQLSYFDHPPLSWWMAWAGARIAGTDAAWAVRLPFILTFALGTWLMARLATRLFDARAGLWAAALMNAAPMLGVTAASWVLPDGPLNAALLGAALCLSHALDSARPGGAPWGWWLGTGACAGLALLSKYSAALTIAGALLFLLTHPDGRRWLRRAHPYAAGVLAVAIFTPVLVWNAQHGWVSLLFQGSRAGIGRLHPFGPLATLGGAALFLLPWIWLPLMLCAGAALRHGPADRPRWLLLCLALPPITLFTVVSFWSHVLFHWAAPGYLMLFPLLGDAVGRRRRNSRPIRVWLGATAAFVTFGVLLVSSEVRFNWLPFFSESFAMGRDPDLDAVDWRSVVHDLATRGLLDRPGLVVAGTRWLDAGKIDYALNGRLPVLCLGNDPREYGLIAPVSSYPGHDVLLVVPHADPASIRARFGAQFGAIDTLPPVTLRHAGRDAMVIPLFLGHRLRAGE